MAKINRFNGNLKAFGSESIGTERTVFGALTQSDSLDDNVNADFFRGWGIVGVNEDPDKEDFNALGYTLGQLLAYVHQIGVPEWVVGQEYHIGSLANVAGALYVSKTNLNTGNNPTADTVNWKYLLDANDTDYDNTVSGLTADNVKDAIDELKSISAPVTGSNSNGTWRIWHDGTIEQWGINRPVINGVTSITFPIPFTTAVHGLVGHESTATTAAYTAVIRSSLSTLSTFSVDSNSAQQFNYYAKGV